MIRPSRKSRTASLHDAPYARFVQALVERRKRSGLSQQALADQLGWNQSVVARIENVQRRLDVIELIKIAQILDFDAARLIREVEQDMKNRGGFD